MHDENHFIWSLQVKQGCERLIRLLEKEKNKPKKGNTAASEIRRNPSKSASVEPRVPKFPRCRSRDEGERGDERGDDDGEGGEARGAGDDGVRLGDVDVVQLGHLGGLVGATARVEDVDEVEDAGLARVVLCVIEALRVRVAGGLVLRDGTADTFFVHIELEVSQLDSGSAFRGRGRHKGVGGGIAVSPSDARGFCVDATRDAVALRLVLATIVEAALLGLGPPLLNIRLDAGLVSQFAIAVVGDKGVAVLPKILRFYLFSEGPHGARLPCFWSQSLVRSVHLRNPKGTI